MAGMQPCPIKKTLPASGEGIGEKRSRLPECTW